MNEQNIPAGQWSRRAFLGSAGALIVSFALPVAGKAEDAGLYPNVIAPESLDSWLAVLEDGSVVASVGKIEAGMGIGTAFAQMIAEELDVPLHRVAIRMGDTATTVNQRGTGSSNGIKQGGAAMKKAGAEARHVLLAMAAQRLGTSSDMLMVEDGVVSIKDEPGRSIAYGELIGGKRFDVQISGTAKPKSPELYKLVGKPIPRMDIPLKVIGAYKYLVDFNVPNMLHGRVIRPPEAGAKLIGIESDHKFPGLVKIVANGEFVGVVCEREEQAIVAASKLKVNWSSPEPMFSKSYEALYEFLRTGKPDESKTGVDEGDVDGALAKAATLVEGQYVYPFQSHACMGPGCAVADVGSDRARVWAGGQKPYPLRVAVAEMLKMQPEQVRVTWMPGPGSYGMNDADDAAMDAVLLSAAVARPVRVQYSRADATAWDPKGPPISFHLRAALDVTGKVQAFDYEARGYSGRIRPSGTDQAGSTISGQLIGGMSTKSTNLFQYADESYAFPNKRKRSHLFEWRQSLITGLRTTHLRDPDGMATTFASEGFIDEMAAAAGRDPVEFRLAYLTDDREKQAVKAVADRAGWDTRTSPKLNQKGPLVTGRGIAYAPRDGAVVAIVAEVAVNMGTGHFRVTRFVVAHDCGFVVNPLSLVGTIEGNLIMGMSRAMHEEVRFNSTKVTSVDWATYPIADIVDAPDSVDIVMLNNEPRNKSFGAGEPTIRPVAAVIANALFDATGVRIRRVPFTPEYLKAAFGRAERNT